MIPKSFSSADNGLEYQVGHYAPPDILIGMPASLLLLACSPRPGVARQHERFPENDSPWLHLKSEPAERPIQRLRPVAHERRQWERRELRPVFGITERPSPTLAVVVHEKRRFGISGAELFRT